MTGAARQRRLRERAKAGRAVYIVECERDATDELVDFFDLATVGEFMREMIELDRFFVTRDRQRLVDVLKLMIENRRNED